MVKIDNKEFTERILELIHKGLIKRKKINEFRLHKTDFNGIHLEMTVGVRKVLFKEYKPRDVARAFLNKIRIPKNAIIMTWLEMQPPTPAIPNHYVCVANSGMSIRLIQHYDIMKNLNIFYWDLIFTFS